jgi:DNA-binding ferritin-like protein
VAERIVTLGGVPAAGPSHLIEHSGVREAPAGALAPRAMLEALVAANEGVIGRIRLAVLVAEAHDDAATGHLLVGDLLRRREREAWLLSAHLREGRLAG